MKITVETQDSKHEFNLRDLDEERLLGYVQLLRTPKVGVRLISAGAKKIAVIKAVRVLTGLLLKEAKGVVDRAPIFIGEFDHDEALKFVNEINVEVGGVAKMERDTALVDDILATRLAFFMEAMGVIDGPGGVEWRSRRNYEDNPWTAASFNLAWEQAGKSATIGEVEALWGEVEDQGA